MPGHEKNSDYQDKKVNCASAGKITTFEDELPQLNYYFVPVILITLGTYFIADIFFGVYNMGVDTLFLCFLEVGLVKNLEAYDQKLSPPEVLEKFCHTS